MASLRLWRPRGAPRLGRVCPRRPGPAEQVGPTKPQNRARRRARLGKTRRQGAGGKQNGAKPTRGLFSSA